MLRLWDLLSDGLQNVLTGGKQEINSEIRLCVDIRTAVFLCFLRLSLDQCDLGPMLERRLAVLQSHVEHEGSARHWEPAVSVARGSAGCLLCFLALTCASHCQLSSSTARKKSCPQWIKTRFILLHLPSATVVLSIFAKSENIASKYVFPAFSYLHLCGLPELHVISIYLLTLNRSIFHELEPS